MRIFQKTSQTLCFVPLPLTCAKLSVQGSRKRLSSRSRRPSLRGVKHGQLVITTTGKGLK